MSSNANLTSNSAWTKLFQRAAFLKRPVGCISVVPFSQPRLMTLAFSRRAYAIVAMKHLKRHFAAVIVEVPKMAESITEGTIEAINKQVGDSVEQDETIAVIATDKTSIDVNAPQAGKITQVFVEQDATVQVGEKLFELQTGDSGEGSQEPAAKQTSSTEEKPKPEEKSTSPTEEKPKPEKKSTSPSKDAAEASAAMKEVDPDRMEEIVPMSRLRLRIAQRLKQAQNTAASLTTFNECDMSRLMALRAQHNKAIQEKHGVKIGFVSAFLYAATQAMKEMPQVNAIISDDGKNIIYKKYVDISVAVATKTGLLVPVMRNCEKMTIVELEKALAQLAEKARQSKITAEDMMGGTFTISNGGVFGSLMGTPILNPPQTSILGLHSIKDRPVAVNKKIVIRPMMYLALTYDHRLLDGREAVTFLNLIKDGIENPEKLSIESCL